MLQMLVFAVVMAYWPACRHTSSANSSRYSTQQLVLSTVEVPWLMHSSAFTGCGSQSAYRYSTSSLFCRTRSYTEVLNLTSVHSSASLIYLVDERCLLLAPVVLLYHQSNCLESVVEPSWSPLPNSGTAMPDDIVLADSLSTFVANWNIICASSPALMLYCNCCSTALLWHS